MFSYQVKKDGFILGVAYGKDKAIKSLKRHLSFNGVEHLAKWKNRAGDIHCEINNGGMIELYSIEKENN